MSVWKEYKLKDVGCDFLSGFAFKSSDYTNSGMPLIKIGNIQNRVVTIDPGGDFVSENILDEKISKYILDDKDVLIAMTGQGSVGRVGRLKLYDEQKPLLNQRVGKFICDEININIDFLFYILTTDKYQDYLFNTGSGSGQPNLSPELILETIIPYTTYPEQLSIASILSSLDDKIDLLHRQNKTLEQLAETLFRQWFVEEADDSWNEVKLSALGKIICGKTPSKKVAEYFGGEIPFIKIPDMHGKTFVFDSEDSLTEFGMNSQINKAIPPKSICVSCIATVGLVVMNAKISQTNQQINSIIPNKEHYRYFIYLKVLTMKDELLAMASGGTATDNLNTGEFSNIDIQLPENGKLLNFHQEVEPMFDKIFENQIQISTLTQLRDTLLPKLMSGEVSLNCDSSD